MRKGPDHNAQLANLFRLNAPNNLILHVQGPNRQNTFDKNLKALTAKQATLLHSIFLYERLSILQCIRCFSFMNNQLVSVSCQKVLFSSKSTNGSADEPKWCVMIAILHQLSMA